MHKIMYIVLKIVYIKYTKSYTFFEKFCSWNGKKKYILHYHKMKR